MARGQSARKITELVCDYRKRQSSCYMRCLPKKDPKPGNSQVNILINKLSSTMTRQHIPLSNKQVAPSCLRRQVLNLNFGVSHCQMWSDGRGVGLGGHWRRLGVREAGRERRRKAGRSLRFCPIAVIDTHHYRLGQSSVSCF